MNLFVLDQGVGVLEAGLDIRGRQLGKVVFSDLLKAQPRLKQVEDLPHHDARAANHGFAVANPGADLNTIEVNHCAPSLSREAACVNLAGTWRDNSLERL